jgi:hypothetical protein
VAEHFERFLIGAGGFISVQCGTLLDTIAKHAIYLTHSCRSEGHQPPFRADVSSLHVLWTEGPTRGRDFGY